MESSTHRKRVRHAPVSSQLRLLTFSCYGRQPLLNDTRAKTLLSTSLTVGCTKHGFDLAAFVFMPEHVHLIVRPTKAATCVSSLLSAIKRPMSVRYRSILETGRNPLLDALMVRERPGRHVFRFWQEGSGHDRTLRDAESIVEAVKYVHRNPMKRGLCESPEAWDWSSFRQYAGLEVGKGVPPVTMWKSGLPGNQCQAKSTG